MSTSVIQQTSPTSSAVRLSVSVVGDGDGDGDAIPVA
jgi:hypothetical protein